MNQALTEQVADVKFRSSLIEKVSEMANYLINTHGIQSCAT
jgi:hypothetical protein